jgi:hypothetical protein
MVQSGSMAQRIGLFVGDHVAYLMSLLRRHMAASCACVRTGVMGACVGCAFCILDPLC